MAERNSHNSFESVEQEQYLSQYLLEVASIRKSAEYYLENLSNGSSFLRHSKGQNLNSRIISKIQTLLDVFSSKESLTYAPSRNFPEKFESVLEIIDKSGIIVSIRPGKIRYNDVPHFSSFEIQAGHKPGSTDGKLLQNMVAMGFERDSEIALSKAIGEFIERYILTIYNKKNLREGSYRRMEKSGGKVLDLLSIAGFFNNDKMIDSKNRHLSDSPIYWEKATRIYNDESYLIPAQLVYWNYDNDDEIFLREPNTNGSGGFFTKDRALLSGLYELIQRDAFLIFWLNTLSPPKINPKTVPHEEFQKLVDEAARYGFAIHCLNTTLDTTIPSFIVAVEDLKKSWPYVVIGGGCEADPAKALYCALLEAWAVYYWIRDKDPFELSLNYQPFSDYGIGRNERLRLWGNAKYRNKLDFFLSGEEKKFSDYYFSYPHNFSSDNEELMEAVCRVESLGEDYEVLGYTAQYPLLNQLNYFVAKTVVPAFLPLYLKEPNAPLRAKRLKKVPQKLGLLSAKLNPWPHPFP